MYFAILGRHPKLSIAECALVKTTSFRRQGEFLFFETELQENVLLDVLAQLGGIVKWGKVVDTRETEGKSKEMERKGGEVVLNVEIQKFLEGVGIVGVNDQALGMEAKKLYGVRRFKKVELTSSDLEIKKDGKELIDLGGGKIGLVLGWQDIRHFEMIDFEKPANGMEIGMMPAKLAQMLVNIGRASMLGKKSKEIEGIGGKSDEGEDVLLTVYDPFCGFGTTGLVANRLGHHFVGSDIVIDGAKKNGKWREDRHAALAMTDEEGGEMKQKLHFTVFKHDVTEQFDHPVVKKIDVIVTEGWLGPIVSKKTREPELTAHAEKIKPVYEQFLTNIHACIPHVPIVLTIPHYTRLPELIGPDVLAHAISLGYTVENLGVYSRKGQEVCREVVVFTKRDKVG